MLSNLILKNLKAFLCLNGWADLNVIQTIRFIFNGLSFEVPIRWTTKLLFLWTFNRNQAYQKVRLPSDFLKIISASGRYCCQDGWGFGEPIHFNNESVFSPPMSSFYSRSQILINQTTRCHGCVICFLIIVNTII